MNFTNQFTGTTKNLLELWTRLATDKQYLSDYDIPISKNGSKIHIKKKNRGKFTDYCGGKVTNACIARAKASGNPTLVKRATFAANARKWKH